MEAANVATHYEQLRDERIARNRIEVAKRLKGGMISGSGRQQFFVSHFACRFLHQIIHCSSLEERSGETSFGGAQLSAAAKHAATPNSRGKAY